MAIWQIILLSIPGSFIAGLILHFTIKLFTKRRTHLSIKYLKYELIDDDPYSQIVILTLHPSRYYSKLEFGHRGSTTTIKTLKLIINGKYDLITKSFESLTLEDGSYEKANVVFPVDQDEAVEKGTFEIQAFDSFDKKAAKAKGKFPVGSIECIS